MTDCFNAGKSQTQNHQLLQHLPLGIRTPTLALRLNKDHDQETIIQAQWVKTLTDNPD